jgi:hypothetical protein
LTTNKNDSIQSSMSYKKNEVKWDNAVKNIVIIGWHS